jgi:hypothetical protein
MRSPRLAAVTSIGCALALLAVPAGAATKKATTAECAGLIDAFRNKPSAAVKDEAITEYAPLVKIYWQKGCAASLYNEQIDPPLRQRIEAVVPQPKTKAKAPAMKTS